MAFMSAMQLESVEIIHVPSPPAHRFGVDPLICIRFRASLPWQVQTEEKFQFCFQIAVDVLPGQHPLLLGLPTLVAMRGALNFGAPTGKLVSTVPSNQRHFVSLGTSGSQPCLLFYGYTSNAKTSTIGELIDSRYNLF